MGCFEGSPAVCELLPLHLAPRVLKAFLKVFSPHQMSLVTKGVSHAEADAADPLPCTLCAMGREAAGEDGVACHCG